MAVPVPYPLDTGSTLAAGADVCQSGRVSDGSDPDYAALLAFRTALRQFNRWSETQARAVGLTHAQHQLLLAVKGHPDDRGPTIGEVASYLLLRHHSAVELINRAQAGGFVERHRDDADARVVRLQLTARGPDPPADPAARRGAPAARAAAAACDPSQRAAAGPRALSAAVVQRRLRNRSRQVCWRCCAAVSGFGAAGPVAGVGAVDAALRAGSSGAS
jgi:hypothetical protein